MSFYDEIADYYDFIFPMNKAQVDFVRTCLEAPHPGKTLLDVGCGTGDLAIALSHLGFKVTGIDSDPEMLRKAEEKAKGSLSFLPADMAAIGESFRPLSFDGVLCFGNTLVHLKGSHEIEAFCTQVRRVLKKGAPFLLQILNYDYILDKDIKTLPLIENSIIRFERHYEYNSGSGLMAFRTILFVKETGQEIRNEILLYPMRKADLDMVLRNAGFPHLSFYGDFDKSGFKEDSLPLVVEARQEV
jgi:glycine/sarcosine N-methyltransferase